MQFLKSIISFFAGIFNSFLSYFFYLLDSDYYNPDYNYIHRESNIISKFKRGIVSAVIDDDLRAVQILLRLNHEKYDEKHSEFLGEALMRAFKYAHLPIARELLRNEAVRKSLDYGQMASLSFATHADDITLLQQMLDLAMQGVREGRYNLTGYRMASMANAANKLGTEQFNAFMQLLQTQNIVHFNMYAVQLIKLNFNEENLNTLLDALSSPDYNFSELNFSLDDDISIFSNDISFDNEADAKKAIIKNGIATALGQSNPRIKSLNIIDSEYTEHHIGAAFTNGEVDKLKTILMQAANKIQKIDISQLIRMSAAQLIEFLDVIPTILNPRITEIILPLQDIQPQEREKLKNHYQKEQKAILPLLAMRELRVSKHRLSKLPPEMFSLVSKMTGAYKPTIKFP